MRSSTKTDFPLVFRSHVIDRTLQTLYNNILYVIPLLALVEVLLALVVEILSNKRTHIQANSNNGRFHGKTTSDIGPSNL